MLSIESVFILLVILAAILDILWRKIPNPVNFSLLLSGFFCALLGWGQISVLESISSVCVSLGALLIPFALNIYRGGDVKLCLGMSAWLGIEGGLWVIALGVVGGGILGGIMLLFRRKGSKKSIPMAVCFSAAGLWIQRFGPPSW